MSIVSILAKESHQMAYQVSFKFKAKTIDETSLTLLEEYEVCWMVMFLLIIKEVGFVFSEFMLVGVASWIGYSFIFSR